MSARLRNIEIPDEVIVDRRLCAADHVGFEARTHNLIELSSAKVAEICEH